MSLLKRSFKNASTDGGLNNILAIARSIHRHRVYIGRIWKYNIECQVGSSQIHFQRNDYSVIY